MSEVKIPNEIYSRVSGYFRPTMSWNKTKKEEFKERKQITKEGVLNAIHRKDR